MEAIKIQESTTTVVPMLFQNQNILVRKIMNINNFAKFLFWSNKYYYESNKDNKICQCMVEMRKVR